jgi:hypothetical protein
MAIVKYPPCFFNKPAHATLPSIFLAGTIDMGNSEDWQQQFIDQLSDQFSLIYNPRRPDWDKSWAQEIDSPEFNIQVNWELDHIEKADMVFMRFLSTSQSPITLLEMGVIAAQYPGKLHVCCDEGFWRKGNVDIVANRYGVKSYETMDAFVEYIKAGGM